MLAEKEEYPLVADKRKSDHLRFAVFAQSNAGKVSKRIRPDFVFIAGSGPSEDSACRIDTLHELMKLREHQPQISGA